ncbi:MAG: 2,3-bisphosphoglycerate-independent phosphoglycerate mutase [Oscillospiraceae bacterium]|nr:2,3-bisphosphoglycerate-independent phosphoglycerate mutase [Oscillospiraceae bacterium]
MGTETKTLKKSEKFEGIAGPLVCVVMDGVGIAEEGPGNAVSLANTPTLDKLAVEYPSQKLKAHGSAVGLPSDEDMGNSEVGHNAMGAGQVFAQGAKLVTRAIESGEMFASKTWRDLCGNCLSSNSALHFIGLLSDANVHSNMDHLEAMIKQAKTEGIKKVRVHALLDGRDVEPFSALVYVDRIEEFMRNLNCAEFEAKIASGGGRMTITMDRYGANWKAVERGWRVHVLGEGRMFASATEAIETLRAETGESDQFSEAFVIAEDGAPAGKINDGDSVVFFNFRGDRAIEISAAFDAGDEFDKFDRIKKPDALYAGMLEYDGDLHIPKKYLVNPPEISGTLGECLAEGKITQLAVSETQKFGHVTYFWNGNKSGKFDEGTETYIEIKSDTAPFEQRPWMKAAEITDTLVEKIKSGKYRFIRANFPNGDMVGHTGDLAATIIGVETVDLQLARIIKAVDEAHGALVITADHGNADEMYETDKKTNAPVMDKNGQPKKKTAHTLNPVPCIFADNFCGGKYIFKNKDFGLSNLAATFVNLLGYEAPEFWDESMIEFL